MTRVLGIDYGAKRIGLAISDPTQTLARPLETLTASSRSDGMKQVLSRIAQLSADDDGLAAIVVGRPSRLDGSATDSTMRVDTFVDTLRQELTIRVDTEDERLSSTEAESRLALRERDWRRRKQKLDAAAAAVILQDYLDRTR
ncbi:MAG TPA: Holliday junction resolvase RuvX [Vicinamibacterales bacterium]|jgi:putative Holliday junction resolvase